MLSEYIVTAYVEQGPTAVTNITLGMLSAVSRMAFDDRACKRGWLYFGHLLARQFVLAFFIIVMVVGVLSYYKISEPISTSITLLCGFFAREILEQLQISTGELSKWIRRVIRAKSS